jgi:putative hydrolase of the HAD superfamily
MQDTRSRIQAIFFDAAGTLFEVRGSVGQVYSQIALRRGIRIDPERLDQNFQAAFARLSKGLFAESYTECLGADRRWWFEVVREVIGAYLPAEGLKSYFDELYEFFRTRDAWLVYPDVRETLTELRARSFRLGVISNFDSRLRDILSNLGIGSFFEQAVLSWEVGASKPDSRIFRRALEAMQVLPGQAVHVGDSLLSDVGGARKVGLNPILLDRRGIHSGYRGCPVIRDLTRLKDPEALRL